MSATRLDWIVRSLACQVQHGLMLAPSNWVRGEWWSRLHVTAAAGPGRFLVRHGIIKKLSWDALSSAFRERSLP